MFNTPILFLVFNRPDTTKKVFEEIKKIQPSFLYLAADGPRKDTPGEKELCDEVRRIVLSNIDWECDVKTLFRDENLGCGRAPAEAITWFFENVEQGIILEDDCLPNLTFFTFCENLLIKYFDDNRIMHISGNSFIDFPNWKSQSYYFSKFPFIWGWATWKRAWEHYNFNYHDLNENQRHDIIRNSFQNLEMQEFWKETMDNHIMFNIDSTWDYQWFFSIWKNNGLSILPSRNLVENIGFGVGATHTKDADHELSALKTYIINFPLKYTDDIKIIHKNEIHNFYNFYKKRRTNYFIIKSRIRSLFQKIIKSFLFRNVPESRMLFNSSVNWQKIQDTLSIVQLSPKAKLYSPYFINNCKIDDYSYVSTNSQISGTEIGKFCSIGPNFFCGWGVHPVDGLSTHPMFYSTKKQNGYSLTNINKIDERKLIKIGNDVFIGANVTVLDGIEIGDGAIIGAGAIVSKNIPPYSIAVGSPIKIISQRFDEKTITKLLEIKWWLWDENELKDIEKHFFDIAAFLSKYESKSVK